MEKKRLTIIAVLIICLAFSAGLIWRWVQGTPYYALYQIGAALKNRDTHTLLGYVDLDLLLNQQISETISPLLTDLTNSETQGRQSTSRGEFQITLTPETNKGLGRLVVRELQKYLENKNNPTLSSSFALLIAGKVSRSREYALVTLKKDQDQLRLGMKNQEGVWRVVELNPEDTRKIIKKYLLSGGRQPL